MKRKPTTLSFFHVTDASLMCNVTRDFSRVAQPIAVGAACLALRRRSPNLFLQRERPLLMLWTTPPPVSQCSTTPLRDNAHVAERHRRTGWVRGGHSMTSSARARSKVGLSMFAFPSL